jgi:hypothetical protein
LSLAQHGIDYPGHHIIYRCVFPETQYNPTAVLERAGSLRVANYVPLNFLSPEHCIALGPSAVFRTAVPKASVEKNGNLFFRKGNIDSASGRLHAQMNAEPKASRVKSGSNSFFARVISSESIGESLCFSVIRLSYFGRHICLGHV